MKYTISYQVEVPSTQELHQLLSEIESETGLTPTTITDPNGQQVH